jgi:predicted esterase
MKSKTFIRLVLVAGMAFIFLIVPTEVQLAANQQPGPGAGQQDARGGQQAARGGAFGPVDPRVEQRTYLFGDTNEELPYAVFVSSKATSDRGNPLVVALHGLGGTQDTFMRSNYRAVEFAEDGGYILVGPMGYNPSGWYGVPAGGRGGRGGRGATPDPPNVRELSERDVMNVLAMIREEFNVDENRTYLMGHSMGGAGTFHLGVKYASNWAAIAAIAPAAFGMQPDILQEIRDMPVILVQGDADTAVPVANTRLWAEKLGELGMTHEYHEIPGGDHVNVISTGMPDIFAFFEEHTRSSR